MYGLSNTVRIAEWLQWRRHEENKGTRTPLFQGPVLKFIQEVGETFGGGNTLTRQLGVILVHG